MKESINSSFLFNDKYYNDSFEKNYFSKKKLSMKLICEATVLPCAVIDDRLLSGIFDGNHIIEASSHHMTLNDGYEDHSCNEYINETVVFIGVLHSC